MFFVYAHYKSDDPNGLPFYIGKGKNKRDLSTYRNRFWKNIANKHGYIVKRIKENLTEQQAWDLEKDLIKSYGKLIDGTGCLCNISDGGEGAAGTIHSQETKDKWSKSKKGKPLSTKHKLAISKGLVGRKHSAETKKKLSESKQGEKNPMFGKTFTQEHRDKLSKNMLGKPGRTKGKTLSEKARQNMSKAATLRASDPVISQKISSKLKGIKRSEETRKKMAEAAKIREANKKIIKEK